LKRKKKEIRKIYKKIEKICEKLGFSGSSVPQGVLYCVQQGGNGAALNSFGGKNNAKQDSHYYGVVGERFWVFSGIGAERDLFSSGRR
jgi:hypothetical protein